MLKKAQRASPLIFRTAEESAGLFSVSRADRSERKAYRQAYPEEEAPVR